MTALYFCILIATGCGNKEDIDMFTQYQSFTKAAIGRPVSLGRGSIDPATLKLTFIYFEQVQDELDTWHEVQEEKLLILNQHYRLDKRRGLIELLDCPFWQQEGLWRAADRKESLLYKGQVKWPQVILYEYEHYAPMEVIESQFADKADKDAKRRLGYDLPKHVVVAKEALKSAFEWE